jgi:hypothetical protein
MPQVNALNTLVVFAQVVLLFFLVKMLATKYPENAFSQGIRVILS